MAIWKVKRRWHGVAIRMWEPRRGWINNFCDTCDRLRTGLCEREGNFSREERRERYTQRSWEMEVKRESRSATEKICIIFPSSRIKPPNRQTVSDFTPVSANKAFDNKVLTPQKPSRRGTQGQGQQGERGRERRGFCLFCRVTPGAPSRLVSLCPQTTFSVDLEIILPAPAIYCSVHSHIGCDLKFKKTQIHSPPEQLLIFRIVDIVIHPKGMYCLSKYIYIYIIFYFFLVCALQCKTETQRFMRRRRGSRSPTDKWRGRPSRGEEREKRRGGLTQPDNLIFFLEAAHVRTHTYRSTFGVCVCVCHEAFCHL